MKIKLGQLHKIIREVDEMEEGWDPAAGYY